MAVRAEDFKDAVRAAMAPAIEQQRLSIQKQAAAIQPGVTGASNSFYTVAWPTPPQWNAASGGGGDCEPMPKADLDLLVKAASDQQGLNAALVQAVIGKESAARPCAISSKGAQGLMQLMPATADELGVIDAFDPKQNIDGGTRLLKKLLTRYGGDMALALGAYNAGAGRVDREGGVPKIPETLNYVSDILNRFRIQ